MFTNVNVDITITLCIEVEHEEDASDHQIIEEAVSIAHGRMVGSNVDLVDRDVSCEIAADTARD